MKQITLLCSLVVMAVLPSCDLLTGHTPHRSAVDTAGLSQVAAASAKASPMACTGQSPSGDLVAQRIAGADAKTPDQGLYEGPVWYKGALYFSDFAWGAGIPSHIRRLDESGVMTRFIENSGTNGLAIDKDGNLVAGAQQFKNISRFNMQTKARTSVAEKYNGNVFNSPNDLTIARDGTIYFTDPDYQRAAAPGGQDKTRVYRVATNGVITVVDDTLKNPNGISLSNDEQLLYVNGNDEKGEGVLREYPLINGIPQAGRNLVTGLTSADGMALDCHGNIYVTEHSLMRVSVFTPAGQKIATIKVDAKITNAAFGGADGKTLFLTGASRIWKIALDVTGTPY